MMQSTVLSLGFSRVHTEVCKGSIYAILLMIIKIIAMTIIVSEQRGRKLKKKVTTGRQEPKPLLGGLGACSPRKFGNLGALRCILWVSETPKQHLSYTRLALYLLAN